MHVETLESGSHRSMNNIEIYVHKHNIVLNRNT